MAVGDVLVRSVGPEYSEELAGPLAHSFSCFTWPLLSPAQSAEYLELLEMAHLC